MTERPGVSTHLANEPSRPDPDFGGVEVVKVRSFFDEVLHPHPLRHPIRWWKLRHFRREEQRPRTGLEQQLNDWMDEVLLYGEDEARRRRILRDEEPFALAYGDLNVSRQDSTSETGGDT